MASMDPNQHDSMANMGDPTAQFNVVLRGYDRAQVDEHLERLEAEMRIAAADRDSAAARSAELASKVSSHQAEIQSLRARLDKASAPTFDTMGERIAGMLKLAEDEAEDIRRKAHEDTAKQRAELARQQQELRQRQSEAERRGSKLIADANQRAAATVTGAEQRASKLVSDAKQQAAATLTTAESRSTSLTREAEQRASKLVADAKQQAGAAEERATALLREAEQDSRTIRADAEQETRTLRSEADQHARSVRAKAEQEARTLRAEADQHAHDVRAEADQHAQEVRAAIETEQRQALEDFEIMLRERRAEEAKVDDERHRNAVAEAEQRIATATGQAGRIVDEAQSRVDELTAVRTRVLTQLGAMRDVLATLPAQAGISDEEQNEAIAEADAESGKPAEDGDKQNRSEGKAWPENRGWPGVRWKDQDTSGASSPSGKADPAESAPTEPRTKQSSSGKRPAAQRS